MAYLYGSLVVLALLSFMIAIAAVLFFVLSLFQHPESLLVTPIGIILSIALLFGATAVEDANTTICTDVVQMTVTKCTMTSHGCHIVVDEKYIVTISEAEYAQIDEGDVVSVEITRKTKFGEETKPTAKLAVL